MPCSSDVRRPLIRPMRKQDVKTQILLTILLGLTALTRTHAQNTLNGSTTVVFATVEEAARILTAQDDFVRRMSPFDRAARMKTDRDVSEDEYLSFVGKSVLSWNSAEQQRIAAAYQEIETELRILSVPLPSRLFFIKTTGVEEGGAAYTRANAVVFPQGVLTLRRPEISKLLGHELFHVLSRANPDLREKLYAAIGFVNCGEVELPPALNLRRITNPDAPANDHCIRVQINGQDHWAVPILYSSVEKYDVKRGGEFLHYLQFRLLLVERSEDSSTAKPLENGQGPILLEPHQVSGYLEQVGRNTGYIIHPEEILADSFSLLLLRRRNIPSPEVLENLERILKEHSP